MATLIKSPKSFKLNHITASTWRKVFLISSNPLYITRDKMIYERHSTIPRTFTGSQIRVYSGNKFHSRSVNQWMVGFKYGEFSWTRKLALYKAKQLKKKKKK